jgi:cold shock protein
MEIGKVIRFDDVRGYGFIAPNGGGEDVFVHVNDLAACGRVTVGTRVSFQLAESDRGPKAYDVQLVEDHPRVVTASAVGRNGPVEQSVTRSEVDEELVEILRDQEFLQQVTELLLTTAPQLTGEVVIELRRSFLQFARQNGWVE